MHCACEQSDSGMPIALCAAHQLIVDQHVAAERERLIGIVDKMFGSHDLTRLFRERAEGRPKREFIPHSEQQ